MGCRGELAPSKLRFRVRFDMSPEATRWRSRCLRPARRQRASRNSHPRVELRSEGSCLPHRVWFGWPQVALQVAWLQLGPFNQPPRRASALSTAGNLQGVVIRMWWASPLVQLAPVATVARLGRFLGSELFCFVGATARGHAMSGAKPNATQAPSPLGREPLWRILTSSARRRRWRSTSASLLPSSRQCGPTRPNESTNGSATVAVKGSGATLSARLRSKGPPRVAKTCVLIARRTRGGLYGSSRCPTAWFLRST